MPRKNQKHMLVLKTVNSRMEAYGGFKYPKKGKVEATEWDPHSGCGKGLHGFLWGEGDGSLASFEDDAVWLVLKVKEDCIVDLDGKVKFPQATVVCYGNREKATDYIAEHGAKGKKIVGYTATAGDRGTATAGYRGTATAGDRGTATAGDEGTATAGYSGTATAGVGGTATAGDRGTATAGEYGVVTIRYYDQSIGRYRFKVGSIGENGLKPNTRYRLNEENNFVEVVD